MIVAFFASPHAPFPNVTVSPVSSQPIRSQIRRAKAATRTFQSKWCKLCTPISRSLGTKCLKTKLREEKEEHATRLCGSHVYTFELLTRLFRPVKHSYDGELEEDRFATPCRSCVAGLNICQARKQYAYR